MKQLSSSSPKVFLAACHDFVSLGAGRLLELECEWAVAGFAKNPRPVRLVIFSSADREWWLLAQKRQISCAIALLIDLLLLPTRSSYAVTITFGDQGPDPGAMSRPTEQNGEPGNVYGAAQGMPGNITATFDGWDTYGVFPNGSYSFSPLTHGYDGGTTWCAIYGVNDSATIIFNQPAIVSSFWFDNSASNYPPSDGDPGYTLDVVGSLAGNTVWSYSYPWPPDAGDDGFFPPDVFDQVTSGANLAVDTVTFSDAQDVAIDDVTIVNVPEPAFLCLAELTAAGLMRLR